MSDFPNGAVLVFVGDGAIGRHVVRTVAEAGASVAITEHLNIGRAWQARDARANSVDLGNPQQKSPRTCRRSRYSPCDSDE